MLIKFSIMAQKIISFDAQISPFVQQHSVSLRIWHWLTFLLISGSIITVLINSTLLAPRENIKMVQEQLSKNGLTATDDQAFAVSHEYEDKMWEVHKYLGFGLVFLLLSRVVIEFTQTEEERVRSRYRRAQAMAKGKNEKSAEYKHYLRVRQIYAFFFLLLFLMSLTGLGMAFGRDLGISRELLGVLKNVHEIVQYLMYAFVFVHLSGVILAENGKLKGMVSGMINGNRN
jgi:Ni/Fe-hydrogenase 1 B-type cytochrome subunit